MSETITEQVPKINLPIAMEYLISKKDLETIFEYQKYKAVEIGEYFDRKTSSVSLPQFILDDQVMIDQGLEDPSFFYQESILSENVSTTDIARDDK